MKIQIFFKTIIDNALALTIIIVFLTAIINAFIRQRSKDKCLKDFEGYQVTLHLKNGKTVWGNLKIYSTDLELIYPKAYFDEKNKHFECSYIISNIELDADLHSIHRYYWDLSKKNEIRRIKSIKKINSQNIFRIILRKTRNIINTLKDAFNKSINAFLGHYTSKIAGGKITGELSQFSNEIINNVKNSYDSILEKYIGKIIIAEIIDEKGKTEYEGILKDYTAKYIELLNVNYSMNIIIDFNMIQDEYVFSSIVFNKNDSSISISNYSPEPLTLSYIKNNDDDIKIIDRTILEKESFKISIQKFNLTDESQLIFNTNRFVDIIAPRSIIKIRHSGKMR